MAVSGLTGVTNISAGRGASWMAAHTCATVSDGTVRCWGRNNYGQLGDGNSTNSATPVTVSGLTGVDGIFAGEDHTCATVSGGTVRCWGRGSNYGQLGDGNSTDSATPVTVPSLSNVTAISASRSFTCVTLYDGTARCWGKNGNRQLGDMTTTTRTTPVAVTGITGNPGWPTTVTITAADGATTATTQVTLLKE